MTHTKRCPESRRRTGLLVLPSYRQRCLTCGNLVRLIYAGAYIVVQTHYYRPGQLTLPDMFLPSAT